MGGNDSADTVRIINDQAKSSGYEFRAIHIPKTVDNDLAVNDHCPGYGSAARYVAQAFMGLNLDNRALPGVLIGVVMGRHAGFLTAAGALARKYVGEGPHLIYLPERTFSKEKFLEDVERAYKECGRCVISVSEGIQDASHNPVLLSLSDRRETDAHGNVQLSGTGALGDLLADLVRDNLKIKRVRADTFGYVQRSFMGVVSDRDAHEARESRGDRRAIRDVGQCRWVHGHPAPGAQLQRQLRPGPASGGSGKDQDDAGRFHQRGGQRRHR